jgi:hypothetical protein
MPREERGTECRPVVACGRLDEDIVESGAFADLSVRDAVHRASTGKTEARRLRGGPNRTKHMQHGLLEDGLQ